MSILLLDRKEQERSLFEYGNRGIYERLARFQSEQNASLQYDSLWIPKVKLFISYTNFDRYLADLFDQLTVCTAIPLSDSASRTATWKAMFNGEPLPEIEENAVEKYAGSLDQYLPDNVPIEKVIKNAKG
jgi:hypothetical protein